MENLWAPWRMAFITPKTPPPPGCIFCTQPAENRDEEHHILYRGEHCFMMLNLYPYNNGHLMIAPFQHVGALEALDSATLAELMSQAQLALRALRYAMNPDGFNMGINEGKVAGAGFAEHIHYHIVPRWQGDTNFMPVIGDIKVMPEHLDNVYRQLKDALEKVKSA
ncbi:HIT domain-containing protein [Ktedonosporobacter rubrisoli]|uniref:HIT domain-containing protein n=1 Tax=Ktedonosporobacter rubrisoli TaxID=2509675 RepID=A0A4P6JX71_KTERU|nr:HIT domain-containing protein [Ktedonosporobacter rubrisoli]QBD80012.1 HIT domain-containing protein [Ktedonosporobacter rubrisoli]